MQFICLSQFQFVFAENVRAFRGGNMFYYRAGRQRQAEVSLKHSVSNGGATRPLPRNGGVEELHGDPTFGPRPKVWT